MTGNRSIVEEGATSAWTENAVVVVVDWVVEVVASVWTSGELVTRSCSTVVAFDWIRFSLSEHFSNRAYGNCLLFSIATESDYKICNMLVCI